jgi:hypothetical protein
MNQHPEELHPLASQSQNEHQTPASNPHQPPQVGVQYAPNNVYPATITFYQVQPGGPDARQELTRRLKENYPTVFVAVISHLMLVTNITLFILVGFYNIKLNNEFNTINAMFVSKYVATVSLTNTLYALLALITSK